jgi:hypothetical protein
MSAKRRLREIRKEIEAIGLDLHSLTPTKSHLKARISNGDVTRVFWFSLTPSCHRADRNKLAALRRFARGID